MAIYRLSMSVETRGKVSPITGLPTNAVRSAAYNARTQLFDETNGIKTPDYSLKGGLIYHEMVLGKNADSRFLDMGKAWSEVEKVEMGSSAQLSRKLILALPHEFSLDQDKELVHRFMDANFPEAAFWQFDIHDDESGRAGGKNIHAHIKFPERILDKSGKWVMKQRSDYAYERDANGRIIMEPVIRKNGKPKLDKEGNPVLQKKRIPVIDPATGKQKIGARGRKVWKRETVHTTDWHRKDKLLECRKSWAKIINRIAERDLVWDEVTGDLINVSEKSHKERRDGLVPEPTLGPIVANMAKRGIMTDRYHDYQVVRAGNRHIQELQKTEKNEDERTYAAIVAQEHLEDDIKDEMYNLGRTVYEYNELKKEEAIQAEHEATQRAIEVSFKEQEAWEKEQKESQEYEAEQERLTEEYEAHLKEEQKVAARLNAAVQVAFSKQREFRKYKKLDALRHNNMVAAEECVKRVNRVIEQREELKRAKQKATIEKVAWEEKYGQDEPRCEIRSIGRGISSTDRPGAVIITFTNGKKIVYGYRDFGKLIQRHRGDLQRYYDQHPDISLERRVNANNLNLELKSLGHSRGITAK